MRSSWQLYIGPLVLLALCGTGLAQFKTAGIKTRQPAPASLQVSGNATEQSQYNYGSYSNFVAAETYQGLNQNQYAGHYVQPQSSGTSATQILDETALFINKTRSSMASGICHKEVP